jgi:hypothetical protein
MWSGREQFAVAATETRIYVSGGFTSTLINDQTVCGPYACGDTDAGGYRYYLEVNWILCVAVMRDV